MKVFIYVCFFVQLVSFCYAEECLPYRTCNKPRGIIRQDGVGITERFWNYARTWFITQNKKVDMVLSFENFTAALYPVMVEQYKERETSTRRFLYGNNLNFELFLKDVTAVLIYVPIQFRITPQFVLHYYSNCKIVTNRQNMLSLDSSEINAETCWIIEPTQDLKEMHFVLRDVTTNGDNKVQIMDIHSNTVILEQNSTEYQSVWYESNTLSVIMINLKYATQNQNVTKFMLSYYSMTSSDSSCIKNQSECEKQDGPPFLVQEKCKCRAYDDMVQREIEISQFIQREVISDDEGSGEGRNYHLCLFNPAKCICKRTGNALKKYCSKPYKDCMSMQGCMRVCFIARILICSNKVQSRTASLL